MKKIMIPVFLLGILLVCYAFYEPDLLHLTVDLLNSSVGGDSTISRYNYRLEPDDSDGDGVPDEVDHCFNLWCYDVDSEGCPKDSDSDGVPDCEDACDLEPGPASNHGCPL